MPIRIVILARKRIAWVLIFLSVVLSFSLCTYVMEKMLYTRKGKLKPMQGRNIIPIQHLGCGKKTKREKKD
jgi:hypothetical protein